MPGVETRMIRTTPFHERTSALNETGLWSHWAGRLAAEKYQLSEKFEYFAVRNAAGIFDTSPLFKYRFSGPAPRRYLASVLARDPRTLKPGEAQYAIWCDDPGSSSRTGSCCATPRTSSSSPPPSPTSPGSRTSSGRATRW